MSRAIERIRDAMRTPAAPTSEGEAVANRVRNIISDAADDSMVEVAKVDASGFEYTCTLCSVAELRTVLATHPAPATVTEDINKHPTVERLTRERDQSHEVVELFVKRMGVTHSNGAGLVEAAFVKLDRMLAALGAER